MNATIHTLDRLYDATLLATLTITLATVALAITAAI